MAGLKPLPPSASAEGETAALQAQVLETSTVNEKDATKTVDTPEGTKLVSKKASDAGLGNYFVGVAARFLVETLANITIASVQVWNHARLLFNNFELLHINWIRHSESTMNFALVY